MCYSESAINGLARKIVEGLPECWGDHIEEGQLTINLTVDADIVDELITEVDQLDAPRCRICGCTDNNACPGGCYWVEEDLCSECVETDRLQDAAPEMLEALEEVFGFMGKMDIAVNPKQFDTYQKVKAAIAKAKGENDG